MSAQARQISTKFLSFSQLLTILFVLLKVFGAISWSWWLVFIPLWLPVVAFVGIVAVTVFGYLFVMALAKAL